MNSRRTMLLMIGALLVGAILGYIYIERRQPGNDGLNPISGSKPLGDVSH